MKIADKCANIVIKLIMILFTLIVGYLLLSSIFSTAYIGDMEYPVPSGLREMTIEHTFFVRDKWWLHIVVFFAISLLVIWSGKKKRISEKKEKVFWGISLALYVSVSFAIIFAGEVVPRFDQKHCMEIAHQLKTGDLKEILPGGYLFINSHQIGLVTALEVMGYLLGDNNYIAFQILNVIFSVIILLVLNRGKKGVMLGFLFIPWIFTNVLVYGTVPGLALCLIAFFLLIDKQSTAHRYINICLAGGLTAIAVSLKSNYLIFVITLLIFLFLGFIKKRFTLMSVVAFTIVFSISHICISQINGDYLNKLNGSEVTGAPMSGYIAMGLQDGKLAPGWYNGYHMDVYRKHNFNYEKADAEFKENIKRTLKNDFNDLSTAISKYSKKIQSEWNNPTFQSLWLISDSKINFLNDGVARYIYIGFCNILQTVILSFSLIFGITRVKNCDIEEIFLPVYFIGGFLFHLIWEAQCIYTTPYFICLVPMATLGMTEWKRMLKNLLCIENRKRLLSISIICAVLCIASYTDPFQKLIARADDTKYYDTFNQPLYTEEQIANNG